MAENDAPQVSAPEIRTGDVVRLKSGGPLMTVETVLRTDEDEAKVLCIWFSPLTTSKYPRCGCWPAC